MARKESTDSDSSELKERWEIQAVDGLKKVIRLENVEWTEFGGISGGEKSWEKRRRPSRTSFHSSPFTINTASFNRWESSFNCVNNTPLCSSMNETSTGCVNSSFAETRESE